MSQQQKTASTSAMAGVVEQEEEESHYLASSVIPIDTSDSKKNEPINRTHKLVSWRIEHQSEEQKRLQIILTGSQVTDVLQPTLRLFMGESQEPEIEMTSTRSDDTEYEGNFLAKWVVKFQL